MSRGDDEWARSMLKMFVKEFQELCGVRNVSFKVTNCLCLEKCNHYASYVALINRLNTTVHFYASVLDVHVPLSSLLFCEPSNHIDYIPIENLSCVCLKIVVDKLTFLIVPLNQYELE